MRENLVEKANEYQDLDSEIADTEEQIRDLQKDAFGADSDDTEQKARDLFSEVGASDDDHSSADEIDELREKKSSLERQRDDVHDELLKLFTDVRLPFDETIDQSDESVVFPFDDDVPQSVLNAVEQILGEELDRDGVVINNQSVTVQSDSINEAIEAVEDRIFDLRKSAERRLDADEYIQELRKRDDKIAKMLYVLREDQPLTKKEMEDRLGLESGALRGQLYHVLNNEPYLKKSDKEVFLTNTGKMVIDAYIDKYGRPDIVEPQEEDAESTDSEEVSA